LSELALAALENASMPLLSSALFTFSIIGPS
jgi:hypothetical protein